MHGVHQFMPIGAWMRDWKVRMRWAKNDVAHAHTRVTKPCENCRHPAAEHHNDAVALVQSIAAADAKDERNNRVW